MRTLLGLLPLVLALPARAQSINLDFEPADTPFGLPTPNYAASGNAGVWNSVSAASVSGLRRWDGAVTGVSLTFSNFVGGCNATSGAFAALDASDTSGQVEAILDDWYDHTGGPGSTLLFQGLANGEYVVDTIVRKLCGSQVLVSVLGSPDPQADVLGGWTGAYVEGWNFSRHAVTVSDGTISVHMQPKFFTSYMEVSAMQLHFAEQELPGTPLCFGDGSTAACPCSNSGSEGRGCQNSASTGGAVLFTTGTTSPDTVVLRSSGERATSLSIFLQGNASILPVVYGDGLRCTGGTLKRLYTKTASAGEASAPGPGDPSITARSAALGVPIPANGRRYYQVWYRDGNPGFCAPPTGDSYNISSAVRILW